MRKIIITLEDNDNEIYGMEIGPLPKSYTNIMVREDFENFFIKIRNELRSKKLERILEIGKKWVFYFNIYK